MASGLTSRIYADLRSLASPHFNASLLPPLRGSGGIDFLFSLTLVGSKMNTNLIKNTERAAEALVNKTSESKKTVAQSNPDAFCALLLWTLLKRVPR